MFKKYFKIANLTLSEMRRPLLLSCILKEQHLDYRWNLFFTINDVDNVELFLWNLSLRMCKSRNNASNNSYDELGYITHLFGKLKEHEDYPCKNYQRWKTILDTKGSSFTVEGERCIAIRFATPEKLKPSQRFFTMPTSLHFVHEIDYFKQLTGLSSYDSIDKGIRPLVRVMNSLTNTATISSCQGHCFWPSNRNPFVSFISNLETAAGIHAFIKHHELSLNCSWQLQGTIENECPSLGPFIIWKLTTKGKRTFLNNKYFETDIAFLQKFIKAELAGGK